MASTRLKLIGVLAGCAVLSLSGCNGLGGGNTLLMNTDVAGRTAAFPIDDAAFLKFGYRRDWVGYPALAERARVVHLGVFEDSIVVQDSATMTTVLEPATGELRWKQQLATPLTRFFGMGRYPAGAGGAIIFAADSEVLGVKPLDGGIILRQRYEKVINTPPVIRGELALFGTPSGEIMGHSLSLGLKRWGFDTPAAFAQPLVLMGEVIAGVNRTGEVVFLNAATGSVMSRSRAMFEGPGTAPIAAGDVLAVASADQSIYTFRPGQDRPARQYRTSAPLRVQPSYDSGVLYCEVEGSLMAFKMPELTPLWTSKDTRGTAVALRKDRLLVWDHTGGGTGIGTLVSVDPRRGDVIDRLELPAVQSLTFDRFRDGTLYIVSKSGLVARFLTN